MGTRQDTPDSTSEYSRPSDEELSSRKACRSAGLRRDYLGGLKSYRGQGAAPTASAPKFR